jgi:predicted nuclease of predicted toxin-antitoxin system
MSACGRSARSWSVQLGAASDQVLLDLAKEQERVLLSEDADFGTLLALRQDTTPSVVLLRQQPDKTAAALADFLFENLPRVAEDLAVGSRIVIERDRIRVRRLPILRPGRTTA